MSHQLLKFSARAAFSQAWNQGIDSNASCVAKWKSSIKAFVKALVFGYEVDKADVDEVFIRNGCHANSIFGKEYRKLQDRKLSNEQVDTKNHLVDDLEKLMCSEEFNINDERFSKEILNLLEPKDCLRLLHKAHEIKRGDLALHLLSVKDFNLSENEQKNLLFFFVNNGMEHGVEHMLEKSTVNVVNAQNDQGETLMTLAIKLGYTGCLRMLLNDDKVDVDGLNNDKKTPLHIALEYESFLSFCILLYSGCLYINSSDDLGNTVLHLAIEHEKTDYFNALIDRSDIDMNIKNKSGNTPLYSAIRLGNKDYLEKLLAKKKTHSIRFDLTNNKKNTLLHYVVIHGTEESLDTLLAMKPGIRPYIAKKNEFGFTALNSAVQKGKVEMAKKLLIASLDINDATYSGCTLLQIAEKRGETGCAALLRKHEVAEKNKDN